MHSKIFPLNHFLLYGIYQKGLEIQYKSLTVNNRKKKKKEMYYHKLQKISIKRQISEKGTLCGFSIGQRNGKTTHTCESVCMQKVQDWYQLLALTHSIQVIVG